MVHLLINCKGSKMISKLSVQKLMKHAITKLGNVMDSHPYVDRVKGETNSPYTHSVKCGTGNDRQQMEKLLEYLTNRGVIAKLVVTNKTNRITKEPTELIRIWLVQPDAKPFAVQDLPGKTGGKDTIWYLPAEDKHCRVSHDYSCDRTTTEVAYVTKRGTDWITTDDVLTKEEWEQLGIVA